MVDICEHECPNLLPNCHLIFLQAISHLIHRDYEAIVQDFVTLDFIPKGWLSLLFADIVLYLAPAVQLSLITTLITCAHITGTNLSPILPVLARVFDQALEGGGAKNINFQELAADLAQITFDYPFRHGTRLLIRTCNSCCATLNALCCHTVAVLSMV